MRRYFLYLVIFFFFFFKQKTAYEMLRSLVGSEMCIRDRYQRRVRGFSSIAMATAMRAVQRLSAPAVSGARNCSVLVRYQGAKDGLHAGEAAERAHAAHATTDWRKYSYAAGAFVGGLLCVEMFIHMTHAHSHEPPTLYPFRRIRNKAFPWGDGQSSLFGAEIDHTEE
eukprot:TRINITY_DN6365_c0_g1_i1.p2 TRINITY_DN6365_c0_g1~~TRINITY_DN6365_c0_g1_i1.p2  ORF type:complete len:168 (+),score=58.06 TRINITY_DN6365_c0_g1_i1:70-573(+)